VSAALITEAEGGLIYLVPPDDEIGILIKEVLIPHLHDLRQLAPAGLSLSFMAHSPDDLEPLLFHEMEEFDLKLDSANIKYVLKGASVSIMT
jgi:hypothetical protein